MGCAGCNGSVDRGMAGDSSSAHILTARAMRTHVACARCPQRFTDVATLHCNGSVGVQASGAKQPMLVGPELYVQAVAAESSSTSPSHPSQTMLEGVGQADFHILVMDRSQLMNIDF